MTNSDVIICTWSEMTDYERREATFRFGHNIANIRAFEIYKKYDQDRGQYAIKRATMKAKGTNQ